MQHKEAITNTASEAANSKTKFIEVNEQRFGSSMDVSDKASFLSYIELKKNNSICTINNLISRL